MPFMTDEMYENLVRAVQPNAPVSVHLTDYPVAEPAKVDAGLDRDMAALLEATTLGRAARNKANVKVRQPLPALNLWARDPAKRDAVVRMQDQLLDELNVKRLEVIDNPGEYAEYTVRPNLALLGPKYGKQLGQVRAALATVAPEEVAQLARAGQPVTLRAGDLTVTLTPDELLVDVKEREGFNVAEDGDLLVALDVTLTPELVAEGLARDFVRGVQDARKSADLQIEDTIRLVYQADREAAAAIAAHADYIKGETLAVTLEQASPNGEAFTDEVKAGDARVMIGLSRVGSLIENR
jgi:isoleucyl-tRNA synthetase